VNEYTIIFSEIPAMFFLLLLLIQMFLSARTYSKLRKEFEDIEERMDKMQRDFIDIENSYAPRLPLSSERTETRLKEEEEE
jgi:hypothetical protein